MGRPTDLTPKLHEAIIAGLRKGLPLETVADLVGVSGEAIRSWIRRGEGREHDRSTIEPFVTFAADVRRARAQFEEGLIDSIRDAVTPGEYGVTDVKARMWLAERLRPEKYGQSVQVRLKVEAELNGLIERLRKGLDQATFDRVVDVIASDGVGSSGAGEPEDEDG